MVPIKRKGDRISGFGCLSLRAFWCWENTWGRGWTWWPGWWPEGMASKWEPGRLSPPGNWGIEGDWRPGKSLEKKKRELPWFFDVWYLLILFLYGIPRFAPVVLWKTQSCKETKETKVWRSKYPVLILQLQVKNALPFPIVPVQTCNKHITPPCNTKYYPYYASWHYKIFNLKPFGIVETSIKIELEAASQMTLPLYTSTDSTWNLCLRVLLHGFFSLRYKSLA